MTVPKLLGWVLKIIGGCSPLDLTKKNVKAHLWYNKCSWIVGQNEKIRENLLVLSSSLLVFVEPKQKLFRAMRERESFMKQNP